MLRILALKDLYFVFGSQRGALQLCIQLNTLVLSQFLELDQTDLRLKY